MDLLSAQAIPGQRQGLPRRVLRAEVLLVLGVSLGQSAVYALVAIIRDLTAKQALSQQQAKIIESQAPGRPWLDLTYQLLSIGFALVPALLAVHLLHRDHDSASESLGLSPRRTRFDLGAGAALAAVIGIPGLGLYVAAHELGINATVVPADLPHIWWAVPVLILSAIQNGVLEEIVVVGYLVTRLRQYGLALPAVIACSALLRGSYHLYQGFGGFLGNAVMGVVFALFFLRVRRIGPLVIAHATIDIVSFVGYLYLHTHLGFLN